MNRRSLNTQAHILSCAVAMFSKHGFNGTSTREISILAGVNEVTIYRHYRSKRDIFIAALEHEFSKVSLGVDCIAELASATDANTAFSAMLKLVADMASKHPELVRILQFASLEQGDVFEPICQKYLRPLMDLSTSYLERSLNQAGTKDLDPRFVLLASIATVVGMNSLYPLVWGGNSPSPKLDDISALTRAWTENAAVELGE